MRFAGGETFGRYVIEALLGEGGMGEVYRASDTRLRRKVALKVLRQGKAMGEATWQISVARMQREARAAAALSHPCAVAIYDVGEHEGMPFIAMELVLGRPLRALIGGDEPPIAERLRILHDVARALGAAHREGLVHRDVKPENVMLRDDGAVKILDFGIARRVEPGEDAETTLGTGGPAGTPAYMAPEQVRGEAIDARTDQFSWGTVAYELLAGKLPFRADRGSMGLVASILSDKPAPLEGMPEGVEAIVMRALEKRPDKRFPSMDDLARELYETVIEPLEGPASRRKVPTIAPRPRPGRSLPPPSTGARPSPALRRRWLPLGAVALALAGAAGAAFFVSRHRGRSHEMQAASLPSAPSAVVPTAITELSPPSSSNPDALLAYREGLQAIRDASWNTAAAAFDRARKADPTMASAHLRYALVVRDHDVPRSRESFRRALHLRASASERDQAFIDALEPYVMRDPADVSEAMRRFEAASARWPGDAELLFWQATITPGEDTERLLHFAERCVARDPQYADCWQTKARALRTLGRFEEAGVALDRCLAISPGAADCVQDRVGIEEQANRCGGVEEQARRWIAKDSSAGEAYWYLARALYAQGRPAPAVRAAVEQSARKFREVGYHFEAANVEMLFAEATGDFALAQQIAHKVAASGDERTRPERPAYIALHRALIDIETGRPAEAARGARAFLTQRQTSAPGAVEDCNFNTIRLYAFARGAPGSSRAEYEKQREAWVEACEAAARRGPWTWHAAYAATAATPEEAQEALATMPSDRAESLSNGQERALGGLYFLVGDMKSARGHLEAGNAHCGGAANPIEHLQNLHRLGAAREAAGEKEAACAAYGVVLDRWGGSKESVTARDTARRAKALGCSSRRGS
ncbi:serine/threonine-protein kinase [Polyangium aurulentum]|uniref:serine/threonine-protein kinase n=1 Tax=Polyangium aurulentum TaxID=2567896 RepID=UPI0010ADA853|nr:serine/threonine-protein kinase [Polyangium aurulentum]UQA60872.1 protein kinase [Polyangium aurulentum]